LVGFLHFGAVSCIPMTNALNIMVVEDHDALRDITVEALAQHGHHVRGVDSAEALPGELGPFPIDLLVIDLNLPGEDGISLAARIRTAQPGIGIIMVTARNQVKDRMAGYDSGADIYLTKPTSTEELLAAVRALARRIKPEEANSPVITLHMGRLMLQGPLAVASLSSHEAALLCALVRAQDQQLEIWQLVALTDKLLNETSKKALEVQIVRLRKKLLQIGGTKPLIKVVRGVGYRLCLKIGIRTD